MVMERAIVGWFGQGVVRAVLLACVCVTLGACQDEAPPKTLRAPTPTTPTPAPGAVVTEPEPEGEPAAEGEEPDSLFVLEQVNGCFDELEQSLLSMPIDQRLGVISGASTTVFQCSTQAITAEGYEITDEAVQVIRNAMRERTPGLTQKLMEM